MNDRDLAEMKNTLLDLAERFDRHEREEAAKFSAMLDAVRQNTRSIERLATETRAIVSLHRDLQATVRVGRAAQATMLWLVKWGVVGAAIVSAVKWLANHQAA